MTEKPDFEKAEESIEQLISVYEKAEEQVDGFMAEQDVDMKLTALRSMKRDIEGWKGSE